MTDFTEKDLDDLLSDAIEMGISYWCRHVQAQDKGALHRPYFYLKQGGMIRFAEDEGDDGEWMILRISNFHEGLDAWKAEAKKYGRSTFDSWDVADYDAALQCALFGEVRYS